MTITLCIIRGRPNGRLLQLPPGEYLFGRGSECAFQPRSEWVSRQHCIVRVTETRATVCDLGSRNGTLVNGILTREEHPLNNGDHLQIGPLVFEVRETTDLSSQTVIESGETSPAQGGGDESPTAIMGPAHASDRVSSSS